MNFQSTVSSKQANVWRSFWLVATGIIALAASQFLLAAQVTTTRPPGASAEELTRQIANAGSDQIFAVELRFDTAVTIDDLRAFATQYRVPRMLAYVDHWYGNRGPDAKGLLMIGLGEMYSSDRARLHSECQALATVGLAEHDDLRGVPVNEWWVHTIHSYATAHTLRMLLNGEILPSATIVSGSMADRKQVSVLSDYTKRKTSEAIQFSRVGNIPDHCRQFFARPNTPILTGGFPQDFTHPTILDSENFRTFNFRILGELPADTAVTIALKFNRQTTVEELALLVLEYQIRGMTAEMVPERSSKRLIAEAMLSSYGPDIDYQIHRTRCQIGLGGEEPQASSEWYADWVSVSLSRENAVRFLSYNGISQARIEGFTSKNELGRLREYFRRQKEQIYGMPVNMYIPPGCEDVYYHDVNMSQRGFVGPANEAGQQ